MTDVALFNPDLNDPDTLKSWHHTDRWIQSLLIALGRFYNLNIFVETGTQAGNTVNAVKSFFQEVYSIEINPDFVTAARKRFQHDGNVYIVQGSSGETLRQVLAQEAIWTALFWLDAHGEGKDTAEGDQVVKELKAIEELAQASIVVLDDVTRNVTGYRVNFTYDFIPPEQWNHIYISSMNIMMLYLKGNEIEIPRAINVFV